MWGGVILFGIIPTIKTPIAQAKPNAKPRPMVDIFVVLSILFPFRIKTFELKFYSKKKPLRRKRGFFLI